MMPRIRASSSAFPFPVRGVIIWPLAYDLTLYPYLINWILCDGSGGSPDYRGYHLRGAANDGEVGNIIGADTHTHSGTGTSGAAGAHDHATDAVLDHQHSIDPCCCHNHAITAELDHTHSVSACNCHTHTVSDEAQHTHIISGCNSHGHTISAELDHAHDIAACATHCHGGCVEQWPCPTGVVQVDNNLDGSTTLVQGSGHNHPVVTCGPHNHGGSSIGAGAHSHTGTTGNQAAHNHGGCSCPSGYHNHGGSVGTTLEHNHGGASGAAGGHNHGGTVDYVSSPHDHNSWTGACGAHSHITDAAPNHTHALTVAVAAGPNIPLTKLTHFIQFIG